MSSPKRRRTVPVPSRSGPRTHSPPFVRMMVIDAMKTWVVPTVAGVVAAILAVGAVGGFLPAEPAIVGIAIALIAWSLFASLKDLALSVASGTQMLVVAFGAIWLIALSAFLVRHVYRGQPLRQDVLNGEGSTMSLPAASRYALIVDGHFKPSDSQGTRVAGYRLEVASEGEQPRSLEGHFKDTFARQRLGRRGSTTVEVQRTSMLHQIDGSPGPASLRLAQLDGMLMPEVTVTAYRGSIPWLLPLLGVLGITAAAALDKRFGGDGSVLMAACITFFAVHALVHWGSPRPQLRDLVGAILVGGILGAPLAALGWRFLPARWFVPRH
jgi:hypothetical protein